MQPPARGTFLKLVVAGVRGISHNLLCNPQSCGGVQIVTEMNVKTPALGLSIFIIIIIFAPSTFLKGKL